MFLGNAWDGQKCLFYKQHNQDASEQCRKLEISMSVFSVNGNVLAPKSDPNSRALHERPKKIVYPTWPHATRKQLGELAEMMFMVKATTKGLIVAKPYGESHRYDFLVDSGKRTWRVQVKSSTCTHYRAYTVNAYWKTTRKHMPYLP